MNFSIFYLLALGVVIRLPPILAAESLCPNDFDLIKTNPGAPESLGRRKLDTEEEPSPLTIVKQSGDKVQFTVQNTTWFDTELQELHPKHIFTSFSTDVFDSEHCILEEGMEADGTSGVMESYCQGTNGIAIVRIFVRTNGPSEESANIPTCCHDPYAETLNFDNNYRVKEFVFKLQCEATCAEPETLSSEVTDDADLEVKGLPTAAPTTEMPSDHPSSTPTVSPTNVPSSAPSDPSESCPQESPKSSLSRDLVIGSQLNGPHWGSRHGWAWPQVRNTGCGRYSSVDGPGDYAWPCYVKDQMKNRVLNFDSGYMNFQFAFDDGMKASIKLGGDALQNSQPRTLSVFPSGASGTTACQKPPVGKWSDYPIRLVRSGRYLHHWYTEAVGCNGAADTRIEIKVTADCVELHMISLTGATGMNWLDSFSNDVLSGSSNGYAGVSFCIECASEINGGSNTDDDPLSGCEIVQVPLPTDCCPLSPSTAKDGTDLCGTGWTYETCDVSNVLTSKMSQDVEVTTLKNYPARGDGHSFEIRVPRNSGGVLKPHIVDFDIVNKSDQWKKVKLNFHIERPIRITGVSGVIRDPSTKEPTGIHVQMSKNWHEQRGTPKYYSYWWTGIAHMRVPPGKTSLQMVIAYQYYEGLHAVSHSQLSLLGWATNGLWEEVGLGSNGESITYEPHGHHRRQMILDTRPWLTCAMNRPGCVGSVDYTQWTENHGGGDFLNAVDKSGMYQYLVGDTVFHTMNGPRLTNATYSGITQDKRVQVSRTVSTWTADDFVRHLHSFNYEFLQDTPGDHYPRFATYTLGGDNYNYVQYPGFAYGKGNIQEGTTIDIKNLLLTEDLKDFRYSEQYQVDAPLGCSQGNDDQESCWFAMMTDPAQNIHQRGHRGLIVRNFHGRLNGEIWPPPDRKVSPFAFHLIKSRQNGSAQNTVSIELGLPTEFKDAVAAGNAQFRKGDYLSADIELLVPPRQTADTFSNSGRLKQWLLDAGSDTSYLNGWKFIAKEASAGDQIRAIVFEGSLERNYLPRIQVDCSSDSARFNVRFDPSMPGIIPITITGVQKSTSFPSDLKERPSGKLWRNVGGRWEDLGSGGNYQLEKDVMDNSYTFVYSLELETASVGDCEQFAFSPFHPTQNNPPCA